MKIAILEWICGGGIVDNGQDASLGSMQVEGWSMLRCIALAVARAGHEVFIGLDDRLRDLKQADILRHQSHICYGNRTSQQSVPAVWSLLADQCDLALVIAPESDGILEQTIEILQACKATLVNCHGNFLRQASDKLVTSRVCDKADLPHPPTCLARKATADWLLSVQRRFDNDQWVMKPRDGAGADALHMVSDTELEALLAELASMDNKLDEFVVQPWLSGPTFSRSAIVDRDGHWLWLPLVTQEFSQTQLCGHSQPTASSKAPSYKRFTYQGGSIAEEEFQNQFPQSLTRKLPSAFAGGAAGWVGVDFVLSDRDERWNVIEVNPRCTTSLVGLCKSYSHNLVAELIQSQLSGLPQLVGSWSPVRFWADGRICRSD